jgi:hypothetical protein
MSNKFFTLSYKQINVFSHNNIITCPKYNIPTSPSLVLRDTLKKKKKKFKFILVKKLEKISLCQDLHKP